MQVGVLLAVKTLADRFDPLDSVYRDYMDEAVLAEQLGFDFVGTSEHHFEDDAWSPSQIPILAYIAARTARIRLQTDIFLLPLHHPLRVSEDAATLDLLSGGRVDLICGTGSVAEEFTPFGINPKTRWSRFWEGMEILRRSFQGDSFTFEGKHFTIPEPIRQTTKPKQDPFPLWVGGFGPRLQHHSGTLGYHSQGSTASRHPEYLRGLAEAGVDAATRNHATFTEGHLAGSKREAWRDCCEAWWNRQNEYRKKTWIAMLDSAAHGNAIAPLLPLAEYQKMDEPPPEPELMPPVTGTPEDVLKQLQPRYERSDTTHFGFFFRACGGGMSHEQTASAMRLFAKECLPTLRTWGREPVSSRAAD